jgi:hypothetical protein
MKNDISRNLTELYGRIAGACEKYDRDADDITVVAVTKAHPAATIMTAIAAGLHNIGESRIQDAEPKLLEVGHIARFHMVGHLQSNKAKKAVELFDVIQSVDSLKLAVEINRHAETIDRTIECYVQVNCSGEGQKSGVAPKACLELLKQVNKLPAIRLTGLMTIGPLSEDTDEIRQAFRRCSELFKRGRDLIGSDFDTLSMGMSDDFEPAIAEGSTMIRVGTLLFGDR